MHKRLKKLTVSFAGVVLSAFLMGNATFAASYTVTADDSLYKIGKLFSTSASTIMADNKLSSSLINPGQVLYVRAETCIVKSGDSLYSIAKSYNRSLYSLRKANNKWNDLIYPGQKLVLPAAITAAGSTSGTAVISCTNNEIDLLARLITAEADSQPYEAKVGVGAVVVNRVQSSQWPNSISSVIYQVSGGYYQFTPVENGWINKPASQDGIKAAYAAVAGSDPTNGALYYFDDSTTNKWIWSKPQAAYIGHMVFVY